MEAILRLKKTNILTIYLNIGNDVSDCTYILKQSVVVVFHIFLNQNLSLNEVVSFM